MNKEPFDHEFSAQDVELLPQDYPEYEARLIPRWVSGIVAIVAVSAFVSLAWYAYRLGAKPAPENELMLVEADKTPMKEKPRDPGGMQFPDQDKTVFNAISGQEKTQGEHIAAAPEEPVRRDGAQANWVNDKLHKDADGAASANAKEAGGKENLIGSVANKLSPSAGTSSTSATPYIKIADASADTAPAAAATTTTTTTTTAPAAAAPASPAPAPVAIVPPAAKDTKNAAAPATHTVPLKSQPIQGVVEVPPSANASPDSVPPVDALPPPRPVNAKPSKHAAKAPVQLKNKKTAHHATKAATKTAAKSSGAAGGKMVQLGAYRSEEEAQKEWSRMSTKHSAQLGGVSPDIEKADVNGKGTYYRLRVSVADAKGTCAALSAAKQACFVVR